MEQLNKALAQAKAGHGQIVGAMGEPGLGKSRLFHEFKLLSLTGCLVLEAYSVSHGKATAYLPVIELLKSYFEIKSEDDGRKRREKVTGKVLNLDRSLEDTLPYLFALLGIEEQPSPLAQMDPQIRRQRTFEALKKLFLRESLNQPLVLIFEDLHWIDGETQGFLDVLSESVASAKILLLTNYRPEYKHEWGQKTYYTQLRLAPLGKEEAEEFLDILLGEYPRPVGERDRVRGTDNNLHSLKQLILDKTQGTPFFMEEVIQTLAEEGTLSGERGAYRLARATTTLQLPPTVQGILAARIDRLAPDEKALLQQLSVIGRQFPLSLIRQVILQSEADLYRLLASLQRKEFLYEQPAFPESEYIFKHALTQDVAYGTVLQEQKKLLHEQTAQAIEQMYKDKLEERYGELAHHYQRSGNTEKAVEYLQKAGQQSARRSAPAEAMTYLTTALDLLKTVPTSPVNLQTELTLQITLGPVLIATKGFAAVEVEHAYTRAQELCRQVGDTPQIVPVLVALALFHFARANHKGAHELGKQLLSLADKTQDSALLLEAHRVLAFTALWRGDMVAARAYAEKGRLLYDPHLHRSHAFLYGSDPGVVCGYYLMFSLWFLGYPEQASKGVLEVLSRARELAHPFSLASAQSAVTIVRQLLRDERAVQEWAEANIALCTEHGISFWLAGCLFWRGWALGAQGQREEGIAQMQQGLAAWRASGAEVGLPQYLALLAELYGKTGRAAEGLALVDEALMIADRTEEKLHEAELWRIKGELLLVQAETLRACESSGD
jgi:predicted ATPase